MPSRANNQSEGRGRPVPSGRGRGAPAGRGATGRGGPGGRGPSARGGGRTAASGGRAGRGGRGARGGRAGGRANGKEAFPKKTPEDLDEGLDECEIRDSTTSSASSTCLPTTRIGRADRDVHNQHFFIVVRRPDAECFCSCRVALCNRLTEKQKKKVFRDAPRDGEC